MRRSLTSAWISHQCIWIWARAFHQIQQWFFSTRLFQRLVWVKVGFLVSRKEENTFSIQARRSTVTIKCCHILFSHTCRGRFSVTRPNSSLQLPTSHPSTSAWSPSAAPLAAQQRVVWLEVSVATAVPNTVKRSTTTGSSGKTTCRKRQRSACDGREDPQPIK